MAKRPLPPAGVAASAISRLIVHYNMRTSSKLRSAQFLMYAIQIDSHSLIAACKSRLSKGNAQLDPSLKGDRLITRWRLFVQANLAPETGMAE